MIEDFYKEHLILIIDDNATNLGVITDYLSEQGFKIMIARNGELGIKRAQAAKPSLILLDVMMPGIDGFETCRLLKADERTKDIPIIFMTALSDVEDKVKGFQVGGVDYITKPIQHEEVFARVKTHLRIQVQANQLSEQNLRLQEMTATLEKLNADKDNFFSIVAHDLKGPFQLLLGTTELLAEIAETLSPQDVKEMGQSLHRSAKNVYNLLENLLAWSRLQQGRMDYQPIRLDLHQIADQTVQLLASNSFAKRINLQSQVKRGIFVQADENMLNTVIRNLTSNALKFTPYNGQVTIMAKVELETNMVEVTVMDTGVGISEADAAKLFKIAVHHSTLGTAKEKGTGLGLIICKEMVECHGGRIWVESEPGQGTMVKFTVPLVEYLPVAEPEIEPTSTSNALMETLIPPPKNELNALLELAQSGDMMAIERKAVQIAQMNEQYLPFANKICKLAKGFEEDEISMLLEQYLNKSE